MIIQTLPAKMNSRHSIYLYFIILVIICSLSSFASGKRHHPHKYSCPVLRKCPSHQHKICGSDGQLYSSHCHLRKSGCEKGIAIHAVHADQCSDDLQERKGAFFQKSDSSEPIARQQEDQTEDGGEEQLTPDTVQKDDNDENDSGTKRRRGFGTEQTDETEPSDDDEAASDDDFERIGSQSCSPTHYDSMKEQLLLKTNDVSLLFSQLDENSDGSISINELWKKSGTFKMGSSPCLVTDLLLHEDKNQDDLLDFSEIQAAFANLYTITMVTLDQSLAVNYITAHVGDNVEIRCDITGKPQTPNIQWFRYNVNLASLNIPHMKVFSDGSLYLTDVQLSFTGNYTCQAETNSAVKQTHILHVVVPPVVHVSPHFIWSAPKGTVSIECQFENLESSGSIDWLKNDQILSPDMRITILNNGTRLQISDLQRTDTGAYSCRVQNREDTAMSQDITSLLVQDEPVGPSPRKDRQKLWVFHGNGISIYNGGCHGLLHEIDSRDIIPQNGLPLCSKSANDGRLCEWGPKPVLLNSRIYASQPNLNRVIVFHARQLNVIQVIATDAQPRDLWPVKSNGEDRIWVLCYGPVLSEKKLSDLNRRESYSSFEELDFLWKSPSKEQQLHNRKTVQIIRISPTTSHNQNVIHLQPIDGHFDLVYDLFVPRPSPVQSEHFYTNNRYAYVTHWDERALVKIDMDQFKYTKTINLAECQPISAVFTEFGLIVLQCQTPVTHQLNGQLILDQMTDAIISFNPHIKARSAFLSPNQRFLVSIFQNETGAGISSTTIIVQEVTKDGVNFLYDVRTTLIVVNCDFVWKNGNYDAILASGTSNREDLLYLSLSDGRVELITGVGRPTAGHLRGLAVSGKNRLGAVTSLESVYIFDLNSNQVECETQQKHQHPSSLLWT